MVQPGLQLVQRPWWLEKLADAWQKRSVVWLHGVRRSGKTSLCRSLPDVAYFDCELPRTRLLLEDPEGFLATYQGRTVALDEVHRLPNPSELLKISADHFPDVRLVATGSSTLGASSRFSDTLAGRKVDVHLVPMLVSDMRAFGGIDWERRFLCGGLPEFYQAGSPDAQSFQEWLDAYWARDILELFRLEKRASFLGLIQQLMVSSGGIFEAARHARTCGASHTTVGNYLSVLEATHLMYVVRAYGTNRAVELVASPKVYGCDTGLVCHCRSWEALRPEDRGVLWEHVVLNELQAHLPNRPIRYWRDKRGHEVDFVLPDLPGSVDCVECKWRFHDPDSRGLAAFRSRYPEGRNFVVASDIDEPFDRVVKGTPTRVVSIERLCDELATPKPQRERRPS